MAPEDRRRIAAALYRAALADGDLELIAAIWRDAGRDPVLERALRSIDEALWLVEETIGRDADDPPTS